MNDDNFQSQEDDAAEKVVTDRSECVSRWRMARRTVLSSFMTCTGSRIVRDWYMIARSTACLIHHVA